MTDLFVIEAPGKARHLEEVLASFGFEARVQATKGHLFAMPDSLTPLGIDRAMREFGRKPIDLKIVERLREEAAKATRVLIATDADGEGDVIAWDVAEVIRDIHPEPLRVRLKGMDEESIREALETTKPVRKEDAIPGRTRAILDRLIGSVFSRDGIAVGRVGTAILGLVATQDLSIHRLRLSAPAKDGGRPWVAETDVRLPLDSAMARRLTELDLPAMDMKAQTEPVAALPGNMGDIMVRAGDRLDVSPKEAARAMQRMYEAGRMSYPRAGSRGTSKAAARKIARMLKQHGYKFDEAAVKEKPETDVHDAPYPLGKVNLGHDPRRLGQDEGIRTMVARDWVKSGQKHRIELAGTAPLAAFLSAKGIPENVAKHVCGLHWRREQGPRYPGQETWAESEVVTRRPDTVLLEAVVKAGLGRPSTWANHIDAFMTRGLVDGELKMTSKGRQWLAGSPPVLSDPRMSAAIEQACERTNVPTDPSREPWEVLSAAIIGKLPETVRAPLTAAVAGEAPRPKIDPIEAYGLNRNVVEELEANRAPVYAPPSD